MPSWNELRREFDALAAQGDQAALDSWLENNMTSLINKIAKKRGGRAVIVYASAFLQKPSIPAETVMLTAEDVNGLMAAIYGMDCSKGLTLVLHTPGGVTTAAQTMVSYLRNKFPSVEVVVPTFAMSAGTMIALASDLVVMGRQSQLGPIDPQLVRSGRQMSARAVTEQFERAAQEVMQNTDAAHLWAPILQSLGPSLLQEAQNAIDFSEQMVAEWLERGMLYGEADASQRAKEIAKHFNDATTHKDHGRRIGRDEARGQGVRVEDLEDDHDLQSAVLTLYHLITIVFESSPMTKVILSSTGASWSKIWTGHAGQPPPGQGA